MTSYRIEFYLTEYEIVTPKVLKKGFFAKNRKNPQKNRVFTVEILNFALW